MARWERTLTTLGRGHAHALVRTAYLLTGDRDRAVVLAESALEQVTADAESRRRASSATPALALAQLRTVVLRTALDDGRGARRRAVSSAAPSGRATAALAALPPAVRACVVLHAWAGLGRAEVATEVGLPEDTVTRYLRDGRALVAARSRDHGLPSRDDDLLPALLEASLQEARLDDPAPGAGVNLPRVTARVRARRRRRVGVTAGAAAASVALIGVVVAQSGVLGLGGTDTPPASGATPTATEPTSSDPSPEPSDEPEAPTVDAEPVDLEQPADGEGEESPDDALAAALAGATPFADRCGEPWEGAAPQTAIAIELLDRVRSPRDVTDDIAGRLVLRTDVDLVDVGLVPYVLVLSADGVRLSGAPGEPAPFAAATGTETPLEFASDLTGCSGEPLVSGEHEVAVLLLAASGDDVVVVAATDPEPMTIT